MTRLAAWLARIQFAMRHICWPRWCARHRLPYTSDLCPECNGARLARLEVIDGRGTAHVAQLSREESMRIGLARLFAFDPNEVARHVRARRRNGLHRALADGEIAGVAGATPHR